MRRPGRTVQASQVLQVAPNLLGFNHGFAVLEAIMSGLCECDGGVFTVALQESAETDSKLGTKEAEITCAGAGAGRVCIEYHYFPTATRESQGRAQTGVTGADDDHIRGLRQ